MGFLFKQMMKSKKKNFNCELPLRYTIEYMLSDI